MADKNNIPQFVNSDSFMADKNYVKWLSDLKKRLHIAQLKAAVKVNTEMLKFYWSLGEDICEKQKQYKWGANFMKRLSLDLRAEFPQAEGFSWSNLYKIRKWYLFYSSQIEFLYQAGTKLQKVDNATTPMPDLLQFVPWRHQTVIVSKCTTINAALFYLNKVIEDNMSRTELEHVVKAQLYEHTGKALNNFDVTLPQPQNALATEMIKDPYKLDLRRHATNRYFIPNWGKDKKKPDRTHLVDVFYQAFILNIFIFFSLCYLSIPTNSQLESVDYRADVTEDTVELTKTIDVMVYALTLIPLDKRSSLVVINVETLLDSLGIVVRATTLLTALDKASHKFILRNVELNHGSYLVATLSKHLLKSLSLRDSTWETIKDYALVLLAKAVVYAGKNVNHEFVRNKLTIVNKTLGSLAKLCAILDFATKNVACRDMVETILLNHKVALCTFT